jgi:hypothetical protein
VFFVTDDSELGVAAPARDQVLQAGVLYLLNVDTGNYAPVTITGTAPTLTLDACVALGAIPIGATVLDVLNLYDVATGLYCPITASGSDATPTFELGSSIPFNLLDTFYDMVKLLDSDVATYIGWQCYNSTMQLNVLQADTFYLLNVDSGNYAPVTITGPVPTLTMDACIPLGSIPAGATVLNVLNLYDAATGLYCPITASGLDAAPTRYIGPAQQFSTTGTFYSIVRQFDADIPDYANWQCNNSDIYFL